MKKHKPSLIIFFVPPENVVNGGIMSIFSLCRESRKMVNIHHSETVLCTYAGTESYHHNNNFINDEYVFSFDEIVSKYDKPPKLMLHVPELYVKNLLASLRKYRDFLPEPSNVQINVMNQNIEYMPASETLFELRSISDYVTQTTAHDKYSTQLISNQFGLPLKHLSVFIDPEQYESIDFNKKENIIAYSPDEHPQKNLVIEALKRKFPDFGFLEIKDLSYEKYKDLIKNVKFVITFGEGFDGYYIESTFSGSMSISVYNELFFPDSSFKKIPGIYESYEHMIKELADDITKLSSSQKLYIDTVHMISKKVANFYSARKYRNNIKEFYLQKFDFIPTKNIIDSFASKNIRNLLVKKYTEISNQDAIIARQTARIKMLEKRDNKLSKIESTLIWKLLKYVNIFRVKL